MLVFAEALYLHDLLSAFFLIRAFLVNSLNELKAKIELKYDRWSE